MADFIADPAGTLGAIEDACASTVEPDAAVFSTTPGRGRSPLHVKFRVVHPLDGATYEWRFGDGGRATGVQATHVYRSSGDYSARLRVEFAGGGTSQATTTISVWSAPRPGQPPSLAECTIIGTPGDDGQLFGSPGADVICGLGGNDEIRGNGGNDVIVGGGGSDLIDAGSGADVVYGGSGSDTIFGRGHRDVVYAGTGSDEVWAGGGRDRLTGGGGNDFLGGESGADTLRGGGSSDRLFGGPGPDVLSGERGNDALLARDSTRDTVGGGPGRDRAEIDRVDVRSSIEIVQGA
jgi:Ca2+-binding RTX toxin-like protein